MTDNRPAFMFLLYDSPTDDALASMSPEEIQAIVQRYKAWGDGLAEQGRLVGSDKLADGEGRVLRSTDAGVRVLDGPFAEAREVIGGYFTVRADDYDEAVEIARTCPHVELGGTVEVRRVDTLHLDADGDAG